MRKIKIQIYRDSQGQYRWRIIAANGRIIADGAEGYQRRRCALRGINRLRLAFSTGAYDLEMLA